MVFQYKSYARAGGLQMKMQEKGVFIRTLCNIFARWNCEACRW